jgi:hypothetical protein
MDLQLAEVSNGAARFDLLQSAARWAIISSPLVPTNEESQESWNFEIKCHNCSGQHIKVIGYDSNKTQMEVRTYYHLPRMQISTGGRYFYEIFL